MIYFLQLWRLGSPRWRGWHLMRAACCVIPCQKVDRQEGIPAGEKARGGNQIHPFIRSPLLQWRLESTDKAESSWPNPYIRVPPLNTAALGIKFPTYVLWGTHSNHNRKKNSYFFLLLMSFNFAFLLNWISYKANFSRNVRRYDLKH